MQEQIGNIKQRYRISKKESTGIKIKHEFWWNTNI